MNYRKAGFLIGAFKYTTAVKLAYPRNEKQRTGFGGFSLYDRGIYGIEEGRRLLLIKPSERRTG